MNASCDEFQALNITSKTTSKVKDCCEQLNSESFQALEITKASKTRSRTFTLPPQSSSCTTNRVMFLLNFLQHNRPVGGKYGLHGENYNFSKSLCHCKCSFCFVTTIPEQITKS